MRAVLKWQGLGPCHVFACERAIEMGKERPAARGFPFEGLAKGIGLKPEEDQPVFAREMLGGGLPDLLGGGEMHEAVGDIDRRAKSGAGGAQVRPFGRAENLENQHGADMHPCRFKVKHRLDFDGPGEGFSGERRRSMDHPLIDLINRRIREAEAEGAFENLAGAGRPLPKVDDPENALLNRLVKESGGVPEFVSLSRELARLREELRETGDRARRQDILKEMSMMEARIEIARKEYRR